MVCPDGRVVHKPEEIKEETESFLWQSLQHKPPDLENIEMGKLHDLLPYRCSDTVNEMLMKEMLLKEITKVLFPMPNDKSPGPDGYTMEFFKAF